MGPASAGNNWVDRLSRRVGDAASWLFLVAAVLSCYEVAMDTLFRAPTIWVHDSAIMLCAACFLLGGAYALERGDHIRITVLYERFSERWQRWLDVFTSLLTLVYLGAFAWVAGQQAWKSILRVETSGRAWDVPMPMFIRTLLFVGLVLLFLQATSQLLDRIRGNKAA